MNRAPAERLIEAAERLGLAAELRPTFRPVGDPGRVCAAVLLTDPVGPLAAMAASAAAGLIEGSDAQRELIEALLLARAECFGERSAVY